jgi:hypothetical protein
MGAAHRANIATAGAIAQVLKHRLALSEKPNGQPYGGGQNRSNHHNAEHNDGAAD